MESKMEMPVWTSTSSGHYTSISLPDDNRQHGKQDAGNADDTRVGWMNSGFTYDESPTHNGLLNLDDNKNSEITLCLEPVHLNLLSQRSSGDPTATPTKCKSTEGGDCEGSDSRRETTEHVRNVTSTKHDTADFIPEDDETLAANFIERERGKNSTTGSDVSEERGRLSNMSYVNQTLNRSAWACDLLIWQRIWTNLFKTELVSRSQD